MIAPERLQTLDARKESLESFLRAWYPPEHDGAAKGPAISPAPVEAPALLRWWWSLVAARPILRGVQNKFLAPTKFVADPFLIYGNPPRAIEPSPVVWPFWSENQGVVTLACESRGDDPIVWASSDYQPTYTLCAVREREPLSGQLIRYSLLEAMYGAIEGGQWGTLALDTFDDIVRRCSMHRLPLEPTGYPADRMEFFTAPGFIAVAELDEAAGEAHAMFGGNRAGALAAIEPMVDDPTEFGIA